MLRQRVLTALVLLALLLPALFSVATWPFTLFSTVLIGAAGWEWGRLNQAGWRAVPMAGFLVLACGAALQTNWAHKSPSTLWWVVAGVWLLGGAWVLRAGALQWRKIPAVVRCAVGWFLLWAAWLALVQAKWMGTCLLLSIFAVAWSADIGAYFGGRRFGKHKLAASISPGKSWEGVVFGVICAVSVAGIWRLAETQGLISSPSFFTLIETRWGTWGLLLVTVYLVGTTVVGDLLESLVKRSAGAKDSSVLLPGHGGVLDRLDGLLPLFPMAMACLSV
jgi:phosphatidate cytidylyltransferase